VTVKDLFPAELQTIIPFPGVGNEPFLVALAYRYDSPSLLIPIAVPVNHPKKQQDLNVYKLRVVFITFFQSFGEALIQL
jgi:hypothetical protein